MSEIPADSARRKRILVIDDDPETARLLRTWFKGRDYDIHDASNAVEGLKLAVRSDPDIILLDIRMPGMDGLATARHLKTDPVTRSIPVILLTACHQVNVKVEGFASGADDYVTKPFEFEEVDARIRAMLRKRELYVKLEGTVRDLHATNKQLEELLVVDEKTGLPVAWDNVKPSHMVEVAGVQVGIVGVTTRYALATTIAANTTGLRVTPLTEAIEREARQLRADGAALVIVVAGLLLPQEVPSHEDEKGKTDQRGGKTHPRWKEDPELNSERIGDETRDDEVGRSPDERRSAAEDGRIRNSHVDLRDRETR